jgi:hypothetical protein
MSETKMVHQSHSCGEGCGCGKNNNIKTKASLSARVNAIAEQVKCLAARVAKPTTSTLVDQVDAELKDHPGVGAVVNLATGKVATFVAPVPYFSLTPEERTALEKEREDLIASIPTLGWRDRTRASTRIKIIEGDLSRDRSGRESLRRDAERAQERDTQRYGSR